MRTFERERLFANQPVRLLFEKERSSYIGPYGRAADASRTAARAENNS